MLDRIFRKSRPDPGPPPPETRFAPAPGVVFTREGGRTVLLDARAGEYFGLDEVGTRVWELLGGGADLRGVADALEAEYDAPRETLARDAAELAAKLEAHGLLVRR